MKFLIIILLTMLYAASCLAQQTINGSISHDGQNRTYILHVPSSYTGADPVPLILNYHGYTNDAYSQMVYGDFRAIADSAGFIIAHPQGTLYQGVTHWNVGGWTLGSTVDDVGFSEALIDSLSEMYNIDSARIYSTGMSNGGFMSFLLAGQLSEKIAAIASVTGSMTPETFLGSHPQHSMPILQMHGTIDSVVPYSGTSWSRSIDDVIQYWVGFNNCSTTPQVITVFDKDHTDGSTVEHVIYDGGDRGATVEHYRVIGGGHTWPGTAYGGVGTNNDIDASAEIWDFFSRYDINGQIIISGIDKPVKAMSFSLSPAFPNPFNPATTLTYTIESPGNITMDIYDLRGNRVAVLVNSWANPGVYSVVWDASALASGIYLVRMESRGEVETQKLMLLK